MANIDEVDQVLADFLRGLGDVDDSVRSLLPSQRTIEASCPDLDLIRYAQWRSGTITMLDEAPEHRCDIRISVRSDDLMAIASGALPLGRAYAENKLRLDASMTDLLRLRAVL